MSLSTGDIIDGKYRIVRLLGEGGMGAVYEGENTRIHRQGAPFFIDKMPNNFRHIGLIQLILPNAKIIDARRDPMDCCSIPTSFVCRGCVRCKSRPTRFMRLVRPTGCAAAACWNRRNASTIGFRVC